MSNDELNVSEERYRSIVDDFTGFIVRWQPGGRRTFVSDSYCAYFGISKEEAETKDFMELILPEDREAVRRKVLSLSPANPVATQEHRAIRHDGVVRWMEWTDRAIYDHNNILREYQSIGFDIDDRKQASEQLRLAKQAAEAASEAKSRFLATVSHEIRTPLTTVAGYLELLSASNLLPEQKRYIQRMQAGTEALSSVLTAVLDVASFETNAPETYLATFDFAAMMREVVGGFKARARDKGILIQYHDPGLLPVFSDANHLRRVVQNLVDNAVKFTADGVVSCSAETRAGDLLIIVQDTGIGIAQNEQNRIFESFYQVDMSTTRVHEGAGLGLYIVKTLVSALGGDVEVSSQPGRGSTFFVRIPGIAPA